MNFIDIFRKSKCFLLNNFLSIDRFLSFPIVRKFISYYRETSLYKANYKVQTAVDLAQQSTHGLLMQITGFQKSLKAREEFRKEHNRRSHESIDCVRELIKTPNKLSKKSKRFCIDGFEIINEKVKKIFKSLEQDYLSPILSQISIHDLIEDSIRFFAFEGYKKNWTIHNKPTNKEIYIKSDTLLLKRIIIHFLAKAFIRLPRNGKMTIDIRTIDQRIRVCFQDNGYDLDAQTMTLLEGKTHHLLADVVLKRLVKTLKGEVSTSYHEETHEVVLFFPLQYDENKTF